MTIEVDGRTYAFYRASDVERDGMALELMDETVHPHKLVMEVFYSDVDGTFSVSSFREAIPLELVELLISNVRERLLPADQIPSRGD